MSEQIIEKGIPIPQRTYNTRGAGRKCPAYQLQVGDSYATDTKGRSCAFQAAKKIGIKITLRKMQDGTYRVWRTK